MAEYMLWIAAAVVFGIIEVATAQLVTVWFALGAVAAAVAARLGASVFVQTCVFVLVTALTLALTRPAVRRLMSRRLQRTNADRLIGADAVVTEAVDEISGLGQVRAAGQVWSAVGEDGYRPAVGEIVTVTGIAGVKLIIKAKQEA